MPRPRTFRVSKKTYAKMKKPRPAVAGKTVRWVDLSERRRGKERRRGYEVNIGGGAFTYDVASEPLMKIGKNRRSGKDRRRKAR